MHRILLFCDSKWRDLPGVTLVKHQLQQRLPDANIQVVTYHIWQQAIESFAPHVVVLNHMQGKRNQLIASYVKRHGGLVVVQFNEGIIEFENKVKIFEAQKDSEYVDAFLCWNKQTAELVNGLVVGCPRFDIYAPPHSSLIDSRQLFCDKYGLDTDKPIALCGDSWPSAKFDYSMQSFHRNDWNDLGNTIADEWSNPEDFAAYQYQQQEDFKLLLLSLRRRAPGFQFVVKTHPMSDYDRWQKWGKEYGTVIIHGEYVFNCLNAANVFVGKLGSMTIAESWLLNTPALKWLDPDIGYNTASSGEQDLVDDSSLTFREMMRHVEWLGGEWEENQRIDQYLADWGFISPGDSASDDTAAVIEGMLLNADFALRYEPDLSALRRAVIEHDRQHAQAPLDGFGNYGKAALQTDVFEWQRRIEALFV